MRYRVPFRRTIRVQDQPQTVTVMVTLHFRFKRCAGMAHAMSDLNIVENENRSSSYSKSSVSGGGSAGIDLGIVEIGGGVSGSSFDASSTSTLARSLSRHAESSSRHVEVGVRAASSTSVGEVSRRDFLTHPSEF